MKRLLAIAALLVPTPALADKSYNAGTNVTHDCATDDEVSVNVSDATFTFTGACKRITLNGSTNKVAVGSLATLSVNGSGNTVDLGTAKEIKINGSRNKVTYKQGIKKRQPTVKNRGVGNIVQRLK